MRIIAGTLGGRNFAAPHGHRTHPMSDKVRGALFNALGGIEGLTVLDAFAGSGGVVFEAISRGAQSAVAIDSDTNAQRAIIENIKELGLARQIKLISASSNAWLATTDQTFDIIVCDPPYDKLQLPLISQLAGRLNTGGILVISWPGGQALPDFDGLTLAKHKLYGDAELAFYMSA